MQTLVLFCDWYYTCSLILINGGLRRQVAVCVAYVSPPCTYSHWRRVEAKCAILNIYQCKLRQTRRTEQISGDFKQ